MKPRKCSLCKGPIKKGKTDFTAKIDGQIILITDIPAYVCENCGEAYFTPKDSELIDKAMIKVHKKKLSMHPIAAGEISFKKVAKSA